MIEWVKRDQSPDSASVFRRGLFLLPLSGLLWAALPFSPSLPTSLTIVENGFVYNFESYDKKVGELVSRLGKEKQLLFPRAESSITPGLTIVLQDKPIAAKFRLKTAPAPQSKRPLFTGLATWYPIDTGLTAASREFKRGTKLLVENPKNGKQVTVTINDYGPKAYTGAVLDLSDQAFKELAPLGLGKLPIRYRVVP